MNKPTSKVDEPATPIKKKRTDILVMLEIGGAIYSGALILVFIAGLLYPEFKVYSRWAAIAWVAPLVLFMVAVVLFSIGKGAFDTYLLYRFATERSGLLGRIGWGILFILVFVIALLRTRW